MSAHGRYLINRLFAQYPPLEPVLLADILSAKGEDTIAALTFISLMTALLTPADYIYTVTTRIPGTSDFTHKILYFKLIYTFTNYFWRHYHI